MSKTIEEIYDEVIASAELQEEYLAAEQKGKDAILAFAADHGCEATAEEIEEFVKAKLGEDGEVSLDDLDQVAGGEAKRGKNDQSTNIEVGEVTINNR